MDIRLVLRVCVPRFRYGRMPLFIRFPAGNFRSHLGYACVTVALGPDWPNRAFAFDLP